MQIGNWRVIYNLNKLSNLNFSVDLNNKKGYINKMKNKKKDLNVMSFKGMYFLNIGEKYLGEDLIVDFGMKFELLKLRSCRLQFLSMNEV